MKKRYEAIDGLRALACIGIVAMHMKENLSFQLEGFLFDKFIPSLTNLVFLFMVISAFGMCCGYFDKMIDKRLDIVSFYKKRYQKILPFFAFLCIIDLAMNPSLESLYEVFANLTLCFGLIPNAKISVIGVGWFLGVVFAFYLLFPFFCFLISSKTRAWFALAVSLVMNYICNVYFGAGRTSIVYCFVFFMAGGIVYIYRDRIMQIRGIRWISLAAVLVVTVLYYTYLHNILIILLIDVFALIYAMSIDGKTILNNAFVRTIGGISFEIYLCHMVLFRVFEKTKLLKVISNEYVSYVLTVLVVLISSSIFAVLFKKAMDVIEQKLKR
ncbi:acyltransferase family protein [Butyrivibrio sp. FCS006]|uniref:acyltransferase family protein n=1 Tax=Butyrivibrio sp. FCS006 TaxID=1280684 RepID=UPI00047A6C22|nr:acyltransferase [Butyrivibrio sp. FCS006]